MKTRQIWIDYDTHVSAQTKHRYFSTNLNQSSPLKLLLAKERSNEDPGRPLCRSNTNHLLYIDPCSRHSLMKTTHHYPNESSIAGTKAPKK